MRPARNERLTIWRVLSKVSKESRRRWYPLSIVLIAFTNSQHPLVFEFQSTQIFYKIVC
jgi:hypothetical protein